MKSKQAKSLLKFGAPEIFLILDEKFLGLLQKKQLQILFGLGLQQFNTFLSLELFMHTYHYSMLCKLGSTAF